MEETYLELYSILLCSLLANEDEKTPENVPGFKCNQWSTVRCGRPKPHIIVNSFIQQKFTELLLHTSPSSCLLYTSDAADDRYVV